MNNFKNIVIGFLMGALLFSTIPIKASIEEYILQKPSYKLIINNEEYNNNNNNLPLLNYQGYTYAPIKTLLEQLGIQVNWNEELKQVEIINNSKDTEEDIITDTVSETKSTKKGNNDYTPSPTPIESYNIGDLITFGNVEITINSVVYGDRLETLVPGENNKFVIANMDVYISEEPEDQLYWTGNSFVDSFVTTNNVSLVTVFATGVSMSVYADTLSNIDVAIEIPESEDIMSIIVKDPSNPNDDEFKRKVIVK